MIGPPVDLAIILVHYRTPELLAPCLEGLRRDAALAGLSFEAVVVDNSGDADADHFAADVRLLRPGENLGYAGGVVAGVAATIAPWILVANPDVQVLAGCVAELSAALSRGAWVCGPRFFWDREQRLTFAPAELRARRHELLSALATRSRLIEKWARAIWRAHAYRHWRATTPLASLSLSGALLAFRREAWEQVGPFDVGYRLYFEETDWLLRLGRMGGDSRYVPRARAVHPFGRSTSREGRAAEWFESSARRFRRRHYGRAFTALLQLLGGGGERVGREAQVIASPPRIAADAMAECGGGWIELSPLARGFPAAGERLADPPVDWQLPEGLWGALPSGDHWIRLVDRVGRERWTCRFTKGAA